jgi:hypothetical protein
VDERVVGTRENRDTEHVDVLLDRRLDDFFRGAVETGVDNLEPGVTERARDDVCPPVVAVESDLGHETPNRSLVLLDTHTHT